MTTYASKDQMVELGTSLLKALVGIEDAPREYVQEIIETGRVGEIAQSLVRPPPQPTALSIKTVQDQLYEWFTLYQEFGITLNPEEVKIPARREGFDRLIVVPKGMTAQRAFDLCTKRFNGKTWKYTEKSLDEAVPTNDRTATNGSYAIWIRDRVEADEELKSKSADDLKNENIKGITLTERLLYELKYFSETKKHLDLKNWTLCSGSRFSDGNVPNVNWNDRELNVSWGYANDRDSGLRSREAVTL